MKTLSRSLLLLCLLFSSMNLFAQDISTCLTNLVQTLSDDVTIGDMKNQCLLGAAQNTSEEKVIFNRGPENSAIPFKLHKENYIAMGSMGNDNGTSAFSGNRADLKFQFSIKYQIFHPESNGRLKDLSPLHFGYTQQSWWDIAETSAPFAEHNFNPELFWEFSDFAWNTTTANNIVGGEHHSNGRDGLESRSWNRAYWKGGLTTSNDKYSVNLKVWHVLDEGEENNDITDFLGNGELGLDLHFTRNFLLKIKASKGHTQSKYNHQIDLVYKPLENLYPRLFLTYYDGYGESLISYNVKSKSLRLGFDFPLE